MSRGTANKAKELEAHPQLIFDAKRDINPFWRSSLFSDVYLKNDVPREYKHFWDNEQDDYKEFHEEFIKLCKETKHEAFEKWKEADTVKNWIVHVMDMLGWENNSEKRTNSYMDNESFTVIEGGRKQTFRPDLIYFDKPNHKSYTQKEKDSDLKLSEVRNNRTGAKIVVEAKYWDRLSQLNESSNKETSSTDSASALGPELQTLKYMEIFNHEFGILTDGKTWRLFHLKLSQGIDRRSFDFDLGNLRELALDLDSYQNREKFNHYARFFYYFFSKKSLVKSDESKTVPFVHEIFEYSKKYAHSIEDDLKKRFIVSMGMTCNALKKSCEEKNEHLDMDKIRNVSESHLFNILFVKSCEVRRVLPINSTQYLRFSLHEVIETIDVMNFDPEKEWDDYLRDFKYTFGKKFDWGGFEIFNRFVNLYEVIHDGTAKTKDFGFEVDGFKESIFSKEEWRFAKKHKISNEDMIKILFNLNFIESSFKTRKYQQIPYSYFTPRQLGSIYESFLEYKLEMAESDMIFTKGQWKKCNLKSQKILSLNIIDSFKVEKGELFFSPDNKDRKMTGAYYTPDYIVRYIVKNTIGNKIVNMNSTELLKLTVCDPAMGSGHFLSGALDFLVEEYRKKWSEENGDDIHERVEETARNILESCIYGVDINPRAVKLAKMSLWLTTACAGKKLEKLDDQLKVGDSLLDKSKTYKKGICWQKEFKNIFTNNGFDVVVGNPPYIGFHGVSSIRDHLKKAYTTVTGKTDIYIPFYEKSLSLLKPGGLLGFITPTNFMKRDNGKKLREFLLKNSKLNQIIDFKHTQIFEGATNYTGIFILENDIQDDYTFSYREGVSDEFIEIDINSMSTGDEAWLLEGGRFPNINQKISDFKKLSDMSKSINLGLITGLNDLYLLKKNSEIKIDKKKPLFKKCLRGKDIIDGEIVSCQDSVFYPYSKTTDGQVVINESEFKKLMPVYYDFLSSNVEKINSRGYFTKSKKIWFELWNQRKIEQFETHKIVTPELSDHNNFALSEPDEFYGDTICGIIFENTNVDILKAYVSLLNSSFLNYYYRKTTVPKAGGFFIYKVMYLKNLPIPDLDSKAIKLLANLYDERIKVKAERRELFKFKIDEIVFKLYDLDVEDIEEIYKTTLPSGFKLSSELKKQKGEIIKLLKKLEVEKSEAA